MKIVVVLSTLLAVTFIGNVNAGLPLAGLINAGLRLILNNLKRNGNITHDPFTIRLPDSIKNVMIGSLSMDDFVIYGMGGMKFTTKVKDVPSEDPEFSKANIDLTLSLDELGLETGYNLDVGLLNELPLYGVGKLELGVTRVDVLMNVNVNLKSDLSNKSISDLKLQLAVFDSPANLTGFWKNNQASQFITVIINILEKFACMWIDYDKECSGCILGKIVEFGINQFLGADVEKLVVDCDCLKNNKYRLRNLLENIGNSYVKEGTDGVFEYLASEEVLNISVQMSKDIAEIIGEETSV